MGKVLTKVRRSPNHPTLTLDFADNTTFQVLIEGYDPMHPGVPKAFEMDSALDPVFNPPNGQSTVQLKIIGCALIKLTDKAFEMGQNEAEWDHDHMAVAFKFEGERRWHCVWATLAVKDEKHGHCVFRSYNDVYLSQLERSPRKPKPTPRISNNGWR